jgi:hypothetical protein
MRKAFALVVAFCMGSIPVFSAPVRNDPSQLSPQRLTEYFNKCRNIDRWLQQGQLGPAISTGTEILKDYVEQDAYAAFCLATAYAMVKYDPDSGEEPWEDAMEHLEDAIDWGYRNVEILETSKAFDGIRAHEEYKERFQKVVDHLKELVAKDEAARREAFPKRLKTQIERKKDKPELELDTVDTQGKAVKTPDFAGKPLLVIVLRPHHDAVATALPLYRALAAPAKEKGVALLGAIYNYSFDERLKKEAAAFAEGADLPFPCALVERPWAKEYGILNLPAHLLVDAKGTVLCQRVGTHEGWQLEAMLAVLAEVGK